MDKRKRHDKALGIGGTQLYEILNRVQDDVKVAAGRPKAAFTLAEVLITIGIIGIVAAMTIPTLAKNYQKKVAVSLLQKMYATLTNAAKMYEAEHGVPMEQFDTSLDAKEFMTEYLKPYLRVAAECANITDCYGDKTPLAVNHSSKIENLDYMTKLANGMFLGMVSVTPGKVFFVDINGSAEPNYSGRDIFSFFLLLKTSLISTSIVNKYGLSAGLYPGGYAASFVPFTKYTREELLGTTVHRGCNRNASALGNENPADKADACAAVIMLDGWKIADDYPWD